MRRRTSLCALLVALSHLTGCGGSAPRPENWTTGKTVYRTPGTSEEVIRREMFGDEWPFTVEEGVLAFEQTGKPGVGAVTFTANGRTYGVNGAGITLCKKRGYPEIEEIWAWNPRIPGARKSIRPIIERGLALAPP